MIDQSKLSALVAAGVLLGSSWVSAAEPQANRATFTVGSDSNCDFATLAQALSSTSVGDGDVLNLRSDLVTSGTTNIFNRPGHLTLRGGFATCSSPTPTAARTVLNGNGQRALYVETAGSYSGALMRVTLENLTITNGSASGSFGGGGLLVNGRPGRLAVELNNVHVNNNNASFSGGGISVRVNGENVAGADPLLVMDNLSQITGNTATNDGGGLSCFAPAGILGSANTTLVRLGTVALVGNEARNGGGVAINGCDMVVLYPGVFLLGIVNNTANGTGAEGNGGGVYVTGVESRVRVLGNQIIAGLGDPNNGGLVGNNSARRGAGIYVGGGHLDTRDIHLTNNTATLEGGGVFASGEGSLAEIDRVVGATCRSGSGLFALERCSVVSGNNGGNAGGAFSAQNGGEIRVQGTRIFNNAANVAAIAATSGSNGSSLIRIENSIGWGNEGIWGLASNHGIIELRWSTLADNTISDAFFRVNAGTGNTARIRIYGSIVRDAGQASELIGAGTNSIVFDCVIGWQPISEVAGSLFAYMNVDPQFVNPAVRDYRTGPTSPAIDYCDDLQGPPSSDFNRVSRGTPHIGDPFVSGNPNLGPYDLGAFETRWRPDLLFRSRFQSN
ncbi:MAG: hypothetical protein ACXIUB_09790 [Wenzhouxiangella sp.]